VWAVKVAMGALAVALIVAGSLIVAAGFRWITGGQGSQDVVASLSFLGRHQDLDPIALISLSGGVALLYAAGVFFSTFISRAMTAAAAGLVTSLTLISVLFVAWLHLDLVPRFEPELMAVELSVVALLVLAGSLFIFTRGELLSGRVVLRMALFGGLAVLFAGAAISLPMFYAQTRLTPSSAILTDLQIVPGANSIVASASSPEGGSFQTWQIYLDGSGYRRLTGRMAIHPVVSPDGRWVAYVSQRGPFGLRSSRSSLRIASLLDTQDRLVAEGIAGHAWEVDQFHFSPKSDRIAFVSRRQIVVVATDGSSETHHRIDFDGYQWSFIRLMGWNGNGSELLLTLRSDEPGTRIFAYDPREERLRVVFESDLTASYLWWAVDRASGLRQLPLSLYDPEQATDRREFELVLVDTADGHARTLDRTHCINGVDLDFESGRMIYAACAAGEEQDLGVIDLIDLESEARTRFATVEGHPWPLLLSPSAEWLAVGRWGVLQKAGALVIARDGSTVELDQGWSPIGWWGRDGIVMIHREDGEVRSVGMADAGTGRVRSVFP
jgi:hypothetical protein